MTLQWIPLEALEPHPENSNRMPERLLEKLKGHIQRSGRYEPLVVRPLQNVEGRYQILNGHHRTEVLRQLGHSHARCDVWEVDDAEARLLLATLNRLEGRDDPAARGRLVAHLAETCPPADLAKLLPEPADAVERLLALARPPAAVLDPDDVEPIPRPMTFFLTEEQHALVTDALGEIARAPSVSSGVHTTAEDTRQLTLAARTTLTSRARLSRADAIERLALWYLESRHLR
jgi:ParB-like chromosome segregation protein Spo0J